MGWKIIAYFHDFLFSFYLALIQVKLSSPLLNSILGFLKGGVISHVSWKNSSMLIRWCRAFFGIYHDCMWFYLLFLIPYRTQICQTKLTKFYLNNKIFCPCSNDRIFTNLFFRNHFIEIFVNSSLLNIGLR